MTDADERAQRDRTGSRDGARPHAHRVHRERTARPLDAHQAASLLHESSRTLLAMLDAVVELFELARRGEECSEKDGCRVAAMVDQSRETLRGIAAGFAAADLQAAVAQASERVWQPTQAPHARETGGPTGRSYAQAAHTGAQPPETRTGTSTER